VRDAREAAVTTEVGRSLARSFGVLRCAHCGDVIGVYEPIVVRSGDSVRETSRAGEPGLPVPAGEHFHRDCFSGLKRAAKS
jgi:peptide subunit release factor RF-3